MSESSLPQVKLVLCDHEGLGQVRVDMEAFFDFSFWMAEELQDLIAEQRHNPSEVRRTVPTR